MDVELTSLQGKRVLVSGGTTGIGRATVAQLAQSGAQVLTFGRHEAELKDSLDNAHQYSETVYGFVADVSTKDGLSAVFAEVDSRLGGLDILIANAGLAVEGAQDMEDAVWRNAVETNFVGYIACARESIQRFRASGAGHIVFVGSISAEAQSPGTSVYAATKAGIETYAKTLRKEVMEENIKVTLIEPGSVGADMQEKSLEEQRALIDKHEMLFADELADTILFALTRSARTNVSVMRVEPRIQKRG
jgi:3-hydroxy acid dehydrogenase/malonic semialdehyde reductase